MYKPCAECGRPIWRGKPGDTCQTCTPRRRGKRKPLQTRECPGCGRTYRQQDPRQVYCAPDCRPKRSWPRSEGLTADERGYGSAHRRERLKWAPIVDAAEADCCICGELIRPGTPWHLDHRPDRTGYRGVAHADCNVRDGARRGGKTGNARRPILSRSCRTCGEAFDTVYSRQIYCRPSCRPKGGS